MRRTLPPLRALRRPRGQVMILGALMLLLATLCLTMVLNVSWAVHERIRVQNAADAQAYSMGIQVARSYNYFAYTNRAIAGALVGMSILSAYHSEIAAGVDAYFGAAISYFEMASIEFSLACCIPCIDGCIPCSCPEHCVHAWEDIYTGYDFLMSWLGGDPGGDIQNTDSSFKRAMDAYKLMITLLYASQAEAYAYVNVELARGKTNLDDGSGTNLNLPAGTDATPSMLMAFNVAQYAASVDLGTGFHQKRDMTELANSARPQWVAKRGAVVSTAVLAPFGMKIANKAGGGMFFIGQSPFIYSADPLIIQGAAGLGDVDPSSNQEASKVVSKDWWGLGGMCQHWCAPGGYPMTPLLGIIGPGSIESGNSHDAMGFMGSVCDGSDHSLDMDSLLKFATFKVSDQAPYGQPVVYGYAEQDLKLNEGRTKMPWTVNDQGVMTTALMGNQTSLQLSPQKNAVSVAKALVYYHHPGDWKEPPNFFNPYWKVKLHPFGQTEAAAVLTSAGDTDAAAIVGLSGLGTASGSAAMQPAVLP